MLFRHVNGKIKFLDTEAELKEVEPRLKFKRWLKYGWFKFIVSRFKPANREYKGTNVSNVSSFVDKPVQCTLYIPNILFVNSIEILSI